MKRIFLLNHKAYVVENGKLKELGSVDNLECIKSDVFKSSRETFAIKGDKISVFGSDAYPMPIVDQFETHVPTKLRNLRDECQTLIIPGYNKNHLCGLLYERYFEMISQYSPKDFENLVKNAVVFPKHRDFKLFIKNRTGDYVEEKDIIVINDEERRTFIYRGGLYAQNDRLMFMRIDFIPLIISAQYIILWGGGENLFAMILDGDTIRYKVLGPFVSLVKTDLNQLIKVGDKFDGFAIYHLGGKLEKVVSFEELEDCRIDQKTGTIIHDYNFTMDGVDYPQTQTYKFVKGSYIHEK